MKKIISLLNALTLLAGSLVSIPVCAEEKIYDVLHYENCGEYIKILSCDDAEAVFVPDKIENLPVTELADGAFSNCTQLQEIRLPEGITCIPERAFSGCSHLNAIVLPASLERIGQNAFEKCNTTERYNYWDGTGWHVADYCLEDIFYKGSAENWDEIYISEGNAPLRASNLHCEFNASASEKPFQDGVDNWNFLNKDVGKYYLQDSTIDSYLPDYSEYAKKRIKNFSHSMSEDNYMGACAGMAVASFLVSRGVLSPAEIYENAETLYEIPLCDEAIEAVNYYFINQFSPMRYRLMDNEKYAYAFDTEEVRKNLENHSAVLFSYFIDGRGGHAVVAYGLESGEWEYNNQIYTGRIITYDNNAVDFKDSACIYFTGDFGNFQDAYIPAYQADVGAFSAITSPDAILYSVGNSVSYVSTYEKGDVNQDDSINALDASEILLASSLIGSGKDSGLNAGQEYAADVNSDAVINAIDAACILQYSSEKGSGKFSGTLDEFLKQF